MLSSAKVTNPEDLIISQEELDDIERNNGHILSELEWEVLEGHLDGRSYQEMAEGHRSQCQIYRQCVTKG